MSAIKWGGAWGLQYEMGSNNAILNSYAQKNLKA
jgi:hypothetical protein